jgi:uncharacterized protein (DUF58 family)
MRLNRGKSAGGGLRMAGWIFLVILILLVLSAFNTGLNLLYIVMGGLITFILLSVVLAEWTIRGLSMQRETPRAVQRGVPFLVETRIENHKRFLPSISVQVRSAVRPKALAGHLLKIPARRATLINIEQTFPRRGVYPVPDFLLATTFPFGLIERRRRYHNQEEIIVYPRVRAVRTTAVDHIPGGRATPRVATNEGDEFFCLREYQPGDDLRHIAWRISARLGYWVVRELSHEYSRYVVFAFDTRLPDFGANAPPAPDEFREQAFEDMVDLVASLSITLLHRQYHVGLLSPEYLVECGEGTAQERQILDALARIRQVNTEQYPDFDRNIQMMASHEAKLVYIASDPAHWGRSAGAMASRALDPREVIYA